MAFLAIGDEEMAHRLLKVSNPRDSDGAYFTGMVFPGDYYPDNERSTYSSAAVILAPDALANKLLLRLLIGHAFSKPRFLVDVHAQRRRNT